MTVRNILIWPDPLLLKPSEPVVKIDEETKQLVRDLVETMRYYGDSAGLSAPQVGVHKRVFVVDIPPGENDGNGTDGPEAFINPEIVAREGRFEWDEGCMSIPGERGTVKRYDRVVMRYTDIHGQAQEREAFYYLSGAFQHEIDHLNGILWIDYQSRLKKNLVKKRMLKLKAQQGHCHDDNCQHTH